MTKTKIQELEEDLSEIDLDDEEYDDDEGSDDESDENDVSLADIMQTFFAGENNKNIVDTLAMFHETMKTQNKILMKISNSLDNIQKSKDLQ